MTDAEVARRVGISERRYSFYVTGDREPDLSTSIEIADVLQVTADELLRERAGVKLSEDEKLQAKIRSSIALLPLDQLRLLSETTSVFAHHAKKYGRGGY